MPKNWKLYLLVGGIIIFLGSSFLYARPDKALYKMIRDSIIKEQEVIQATLEEEVTRLNLERDGYIKQLDKLATDRIILQERVKALEGKLRDVETQLSQITAPSDPDVLVTKFRELGFVSATKIRRK